MHAPRVAQLGADAYRQGYLKAAVGVVARAFELTAIFVEARDTIQRGAQTAQMLGLLEQWDRSLQRFKRLRRPPKELECIAPLEFGFALDATFADGCGHLDR